MSKHTNSSLQVKKAALSEFNSGAYSIVCVWSVIPSNGPVADVDHISLQAA